MSGYVLCAGFRMPAMQEKPSARVPGVRKPPKNEPAGDGARRGRAPGYGDFANAEGAYDGAQCVWLRARRERPRCRRTAEQRHELAPPHSITSSAVICMITGTVR